MVDKATARMLVYGALGTLALVLIVAIYAIASKNQLQGELDQQLEALSQRESKLAQERQRRAEAMAKFSEAQEVTRTRDGRSFLGLISFQALSRREEEAKDLQKQRDFYSDESKKAHDQADSLDSEAGLLRRKLWDKQDQARMEQLEHMDEEALRKELEEEGAEFFKDADELAHETPGGEDDEDLKEEVKARLCVGGGGVCWLTRCQAAKEFHERFDEAEQKLKTPGEEGDERALEDLEEFGEQNEVYLDELQRDVKKHGKNWKVMTGLLLVRSSS